MISQKSGSVINIASIKAVSNLATMSSFTYSMTKSAIVSMTKSLAKVYTSTKGIRFNVINPGYVETDLVNDWNEDTFKSINDGTLLGRIAKPSEIASLVMFLASSESSYLLGSEIIIDGGYLLQGK